MIAAATSDLPLAVGPKSPMTSMAQATARASCAPASVVDVALSISTVDEFARLGVAGEVDRRVAARPPAQEVGLGAAVAFDEHFLDGADPRAVPLGRDPLHDVDERSIRSRLTSSGTWSGIAAASVPARGE